MKTRVLDLVILIKDLIISRPVHSGEKTTFLVVPHLQVASRPEQVSQNILTLTGSCETREHIRRKPVSSHSEEKSTLIQSESPPPEIFPSLTRALLLILCTCPACPALRLVLQESQGDQGQPQVSLEVRSHSSDVHDIMLGWIHHLDSSKTLHCSP